MTKKQTVTVTVTAAAAASSAAAAAPAAAAADGDVAVAAAAATERRMATKVGTGIRLTHQTNQTTTEKREMPSEGAGLARWSRPMSTGGWACKKARRSGPLTQPVKPDGSGIGGDLVALPKRSTMATYLCLRHADLNRFPCAITPSPSLPPSLPTSGLARWARLP
jgi:hypothetical protein